MLVQPSMMQNVVGGGEGTREENMNFYTDRSHFSGGGGEGRNDVSSGNMSIGHFVMKDSTLMRKSPLKFVKMPRHPNLISLEKELANWYTEMTKQRPVTNNDIANKARQLGKKFQIHKGFLYSRGWVCRFKKRYNFTKTYIFASSLKNKPASAATSQMALQNRKFTRKQEPELSSKDDGEEMEIEDFANSFDVEDTYCMHPCTLYYKALPDAAKGPPLRSDILRIILVTNRDGSDKQSAIVIGSEKLTKDTHDDHISYFATENGQLDQMSFDMWISQFDARMRKQRKNAVLLVNDTYAEMMSVPDGMTNVEVVFSSSMTHEESKNLSQVFRANYRQLQVCHLNECLQGKKAPSLSLDEALIFIKLAWDETFYPIPDNIQEEMEEIDVELAYLMQDIRRPMGIQKLLSPKEYFSLEDDDMANEKIMQVNGLKYPRASDDYSSQLQTQDGQIQFFYKQDDVNDNIEVDDDIEIIEESQNDSSNNSLSRNSISRPHTYRSKCSEAEKSPPPPSGHPPKNGQEESTTLHAASIKVGEAAFKTTSFEPGHSEGEIESSFAFDDFPASEVGALHPSSVPSDGEARQALLTIRKFLEGHRALDDLNYKRLKFLTQSVEAIIVGHSKQRTITDYFTKT